MMSRETPEGRIAAIRGQRWIKYTRAEQVLSELDRLLTAPKAHRMPNLLIVGDTNNGKTMIINRFAKRNPSRVRLNQESSSVPVVVVQAPPVPDESRFFNAILSSLYAPFRASARVDQRQLQVLRLLELVGAKMLIIDEIHHVLAGSMAKQRHFLNTIKYLGNELMIPIVAVGTRDAFNALHTDPQLANRFEPAVLPNWSLNDELARLLAAFELAFPLANPSRLIETSTASRILALSEGTIGEISALLTRAAVRAIETGREVIDIAMLEGCGYVPPADRRRPL